MKRIYYYLKVRSPSNQWRTVKCNSQEELDEQKDGYIKFQWSIVEMYIKEEWDTSNQIKLEL